MSEVIGTTSNIHLDDHVDCKLAEYVDPTNPRSFFLFAGAGSGKTRSLVNTLNHVRKVHGRYLAYRGQRIGVITYTNAACDEIKRRLDFNPLFSVSTIHSFSWDMIKGFTHDIREWLRFNLQAEIADLNEKEAKGRAGTKASITRLAKIASKARRLNRLDEIKAFAYSPTGENSEPNSLNHTEVISICSDFLTSKPLMQWILVGRFPFLLIDESQDTNKHLVDAFFATAAAHQDHFGLGLIGDVMQRIYSDGKEKIERGFPKYWATPTKQLNHRCPKRVVELINKIRTDEDNHMQVPRTDAIDGYVQIFIRRSDEANKQLIEDTIRTQMASVTDDEEWQERDKCKILTLEHHMAAKRLGFEQVLAPLYGVDRWKTGLLDGSLPITRFFTQIILPLVGAIHEENEFAVARVVREFSPFLERDSLRDAVDVRELLNKANEAISLLKDLWDGSEPTCGQILDNISVSGLFTLPTALVAVAKLRSTEPEFKNKYGELQNEVAPGPTNAEEIGDESQATDRLDEETQALQDFLVAPFGQIKYYYEYVSGLAPFDTHQGVKGLEFDRVMVILDDADARGFMFGYEKLLGAKGLSKTDIKKVSEGKETGIDRTRRLLYVTCSRAEESLAVVVYTDNPSAVKAHVLKKEWFLEGEIDVSF